MRFAIARLSPILSASFVIQTREDSRVCAQTRFSLILRLTSMPECFFRPIAAAPGDYAACFGYQPSLVRSIDTDVGSAILLQARYEKTNM